MVQTILILYGVLSGIAIVLYIPKLLQICYAFKNIPKKTATRKRKISVVIPARNEFSVIGALFDSIARQSYDKEYYDINVIVKEENDPTVQLARDFGANVIVVPEQTCKGAALDGYFKSLTQEELEGYEAFAIVDADAVLSDDYFSSLNDMLEYEDYDVFVTRKLVKNYLGGKNARSLACGASGLNYPMIDELGNNYRSRRGLACNLCGQGLIVRKKVIKEIGGWPFRTLTEDVELRMVCMLNDYKTMYYAHAVLYTEEALTLKAVNGRRVRWIQGLSQCDDLYKKRLAEKSKQKFNPAIFEYRFGLIPLISFIGITLLTMLGGLTLAIYYGAHDGIWYNALLYLTLLPFGIMYFFALAFTALAMIVNRDNLKSLLFREKLALLLFTPLYMLQYFFIYIKAKFFTKVPTDWVQTERVDYTK